ncbi:MAG: ABC transporter permease [Alkaliphilus sp.]
MFNLWTAFFSELKVQFINDRRYFVNSFSDFIVYYILFMGIYFIIRSSSDLPNEEISRMISVQMVGFVSWFFFSLTISFLANGISAEIYRGTFEQLCICSNNIVTTYFLKLIVLAIRNIILAFPLVLMIRISTGAPLLFNFTTLLVFITMAFGVFGLSLILAGIEVYYKRIGQLPFIISIIFLGGTIFDISQMPETLQKIVYFLPFAKGTDMMKNSVLGTENIMNTDMIFLAANSTVYFIIGLTMFYCLFNKAKLKGRLGNY